LVGGINFLGGSLFDKWIPSKHNLWREEDKRRILKVERPPVFEEELCRASF
jgi:hypothetical protein